MAFSLKDKHIIVVWHYVENPRSDRPGIHPCSVSEFQEQVDFLSRNYRATSLEEVFKGAQSNSNERLCALTFDDGLRDQYENTLPVLEKYNIPATFFIITSTFDGKVPFTHKIHALLSLLEPGELVDKFHHFLRIFLKKDAPQYFIPTDTYLNNARRHEDIRVGNFKEIFILKLPEEIKIQFLDWIFKEINIDEESLGKEIFINEDEMLDLKKRGFSVGSHTHTHDSFAHKTKKEIQRDVNESQERLFSIIGERGSSFCYPFGYLSRDPDVALGVLGNEGFTHAVTLERRPVTPIDNPLLLPRYDTRNIRECIARQYS